MADGNLNKELILLNRQLEKLGASTAEINAIQRAFKALSGDAQGSAAEMERVRSRVEQLKTESEALNTPFKDLLKIVQENSAALDSNVTAISKAKSLQNKVVSITQDLKMDNEGITDLSKRQLDTKLNTLEKTRQQLTANADLAQIQLDQLTASGAMLEKDQKRADKLKEILKYSEDFDEGLNGIIAKTKQRLDLERSINENMGVAGALVGGTGALMERLGMRSGIFHQAMEDANEEMREMAKNMGDNVSFMNKLKIAAKGFSTLADGFGPALRDPTVIVGKIVTAFFDVNKAQTEFIQLTGQSAASLGGVNTEVASMTDLLKTAAAFTKQTGLNAAAIFTPQQIGQIADATELLGISAEQGVKLGMIMKQTGKSADDIGNAIYRNVDAGISNKVVYDDVLSASDDIVASSGGNVEALGRAASAARKLGLDLSKVNQIADGLLDFESSIESELEAQLLTGKNINLSKARELALNNDLEGVAKELEKNGASAAEFAKMNRIQQESLAKAMGMSRQELGKMVLTKEAMANMSDDEIAAARGMTLEQSKQMDIQAKIQKSMDRLAQAFAPILEAVVPIVEALLTIIRPIASAIGYLLKFKAVSIALTTVLATIAGFFAAKKIANFVGIGIKGFNAMRSSLSGLGGGLESVKSLFGKAGKSITDSFSKGLGDKTKVAFDKSINRFRDQATGKLVSADNAKKLGAKMPDSLKKTGDKVGDLGKKTEGIKADSGAGIRGFLKGLGDGLASIGRQIGDVIKGSIAIGVAGLALGGSFALALKMVKDVDPTQMLAFAGSLSTLGLTLAVLGKVGGSIIQGALAMGILGIALIPAAYGFSLLKDINPGQMFAFAGALTLLGLAAAGLGFLFPFIATGAGAIALLGASLIPAALAFNLLGNTPIDSIISKLTGLAAIAPQLLLVGAGLMGIAAGLGMIAISGIAAIPALAALSAFALVASPLAALGGLFGDGEEEDNSMAEISSKLDTLISVVSAGGNVYLDGDKVGEAQVLGTYKLS
jgi:hypothetical protein